MEEKHATSFQLPNPRKGTETKSKNCSIRGANFRFQLPNPRKGTETRPSPQWFGRHFSFQLPNPRKGTETFCVAYCE